LINAAQDAEFIFEATTEGCSFFSYKNQKSIYTATKLKIERIYKGNLQPGTINIIVQGGALNGRVETVFHQLTGAQRGVFFCNISRTTGLPDSLKSSNSFELILIADAVNITSDSTYEYPGSLFTNESEFHNFLRQYSGIDFQTQKQAGEPAPLKNGK
jgi:hypothetical protein